MEPSIDDIKRFEKKVYLFCLAGLAAGAILLALVWKTGGVIGGIVGTAGIILIILALVMIGFFFNFFYKVKAKMDADASMESCKESQITWPEWFTKWGRGVLVMILTAVLYIFGSMHENDFGGNRFVFHSIIGGVIAGLVVYNIVKLQKPNWNNNPNLSIEIGLYIVAGCVYLFVSLGVVANQRFAKAPASCKEFTLMQASAPYIVIDNNGKKERFKPSRAFAEQAVGKKTVLLCIKKGYFGYEYVESFRFTDD